MRLVLLVSVFTAILIGHFFYATRTTSSSGGNGAWASYKLTRTEEALRMRRQSLSTATGGVALGGLLWASVCFLTGCCGSPMLPIYLGLLGPKFLGVTKPLTFALTLLSILIGCAVLRRRSQNARTE